MEEDTHLVNTWSCGVPHSPHVTCAVPSLKQPQSCALVSRSGLPAGTASRSATKQRYRATSAILARRWCGTVCVHAAGGDRGKHLVSIC